jgi:hypothetical protein
MRMDGYSKMAVSGLGIPFGMPIGVVAAGWSWILAALKAPYLLDFRHKKGRPWTPLDVYLVGRGRLNLTVKALILLIYFSLFHAWDTNRDTAR